MFIPGPHLRIGNLSAYGPIRLLTAVFLWFFVSAAVLAAAPEQQPLSPARLQLKWRHQFQFAGYYAAEAKGFYRQAGLEVTILEGNADRPPIREVLAGRAEFGVSDADVLRMYLEGKPLVVLASIFQHSPYILMTRADSGIRTPAQLQGKTVMLSDEQGILQLKALFRREGIPLAGVKIVPHVWDNSVLISGQVDAISAYSTVEPFQLRVRGIEPAMIRAMDYGVDFYGDTLFTTQALLERSPEEVEGFRKASLQGWEYAMEHPEEIIDLILEMPGVRERGVTRELLQFEANAMRELILPDLVEIGHMNPGRWAAMARAYADIGEIQRVPTERQLDDFIYDPEESSNRRWFRTLLIILGAVGLLAIWAFVWNAQLRRAVRKRTAALQESESNLRVQMDLVSLSHEAFVVRTASGKIVGWNKGAEQLYGWSAQEALGKTTQSLLATGVAGSPPEMEQTLHETGKWEGLLTQKRRDGSLLLVDSRQVLSATRSGGERLVLETNRDMTERQKAEDALRESEERFRGTFENAAVGIANVGIRGEWLEVNQKLCQILGYSRSDLLGKNTFEFQHPDDVHLDLPLFQRIVAGELDSYHLDKRCIHKQGHVVWVHVTTGARRDEHGQVRYCVSVVQDVTDRKQAEHELKRAREDLALANADLEKRVDERTAELREAVTELEQVSYSLVHDLRAPLRAVQGFSAILEEDSGTRLSATAHDLLARIKTAAERMDQLICDVLNYTKVVGGALPMGPVDVVELTKGIVDTYPNLQPPRVNIEVAPDLPLVFGNPSALTQCLANLLENAVEFGKPGKVPRVWVEARPGHDGWTRIIVRDDGLGIAPEHLGKVFGVFQQLATGGGGTGMGLAIVRKAAERMGGRVGVESEPGVGSSFWIELKRAEPIA